MFRRTTTQFCILSLALALGLGCLSQAALAQQASGAQAADPAAEAPVAAAPAPATDASAAAAAPAPQAAEAPTEAPAAKPTPAPYSLPFQLRAAAVATVIRSDTAFAFYENPVNHNGGNAIASMLLASYKLTDSFAPLIRLAVVSNSPPSVPSVPGASAPGGGFAVVNPMLGGTYLFKLAPELRLSLYLCFTIPVGMGGGNKPDADVALAAKSGILARSSLDNALFAVNDFAVLPGVDLAYVAHGLTVQGEATLLQLTRVRGDQAPAPGKLAPNPDASKTALAMGVHVGYFFIPELSGGVELRHQRWLSTPVAVKNDLTGTLRDNTTLAFGVRCHVKLSDKIWIRPGLVYAMGLDDPLHKQGYKIVQLDVPVQF